MMLEMAEKPLIVYALPPESPWGHPIRDAYGLVRVRESGYWEDGYRQRKFKKLRAKHRAYHHEVACMQGSKLTKQQLLAWGGEHFARYGISEKELDGFLDYVRHLEFIASRITAVNGTIASFGTACNPKPILDWTAFMHRNIHLCGVGIFSVPESRKMEAAAFVQACLVAGNLWHRIDSRWPLDAIANAHRRQEMGRPRGKVIVNI
jgi:NADPH:quinone reductase-like Zn-dependent oxidoreductase